MAKIQFKVSAKAARLIGRENITGVDGAIIELVKNAYDADATCVYIKYAIKYPYLMGQIMADIVDQDLSDEELVVFKSIYTLGVGGYIKKSREEYITEQENRETAGKEYDELEQQVQRILFSRNFIILIDNGCGMDRNIIESSWMRIGTSDKETNYISARGRVKTGAKGIGRFALDKLATETVMFTRAAKNPTILWKINWEQFSNVKLLNEIDAELTEYPKDFSDIVKELVGDDFKKIAKHNWENGTAIILKPMREPWNERLYKKINTSLNNLNPMSNEDVFDILVENLFSEENSMLATKYEMTKNDYDYKINSTYDGKDTVVIKIERNEMITRFFSFEQEYSGVSEKVTLNTEDFWKREAFKQDNYGREEYDKEIVLEYDVSKLLPNGFELDGIKKVGPFSFDFYFLKTMKSPFVIIKDVKKNLRKTLLDKNAGIKIYRDEFKVRPYGEEGMLFDWLGLADLAAKQPAAVTHLSGQWNVPPYQIIGNVHIGRDQNPLLYDMANREGLVANDQYYAFTALLLKIIEKFEYDRQYYYREYAKWIEENEPTRRQEQVVDTIVSIKKGAGKGNKTQETTFTETEYQEAIVYEHDRKERLENILQLLMAFSASGIMTNTFAHELSRVGERVGDRMLHIKSCIDDILDYKEYQGDEVFNPYIVIDDSIKNDAVMQSWIDVIMKAVEKGSDEIKIIDLAQEVDRINEIWTPLMQKKKITISQFKEENYNKHYISVASIDLFTLINNLNINSAWFLERDKVSVRTIQYTVYEQAGKVVLEMINSGPGLDSKYKQTPNVIFEPRVSSKGEEGTGLGLWIVKQIIDRYDAQITVLPLEKGFGLKILFNKEVIND